jgi:exodeoxyribonuclease VII small subunit
MSAQPASYESAVERLEEIIEGRELIEYSAGELDAVGKGLEELRLDELIERLEGPTKESP